MSQKEEVMVEEPVKETKQEQATNTTPPKEEGSFKIKKVTKPKQLGEG